MTKARTVLQARLDAGIHERFTALAKARGLSDSELLRMAINREIEASEAGVEGAVTRSEPEQKDRITVWMAARVLVAAKERAKSKGMNPSRWIAALVQSNIGRAPVLTENELKAVESSIRELAAIGRNINQIARALNESHFQVERVRLERLADLSSAIRRTRDEIMVLVRAGRSVWKAGDDQI
jgi:hypothetical protein